MVESKAISNSDIYRTIEAFESRAWRSCNSSLKSMTLPKIPRWFDSMMSTRILPVLSEIGMDVSFGRSLLQMAMPAWELLGPMTDKTVFYEPEALSELQEVEQGLLRKAENIYTSRFWPSLKAPQDFLNTVKQSMHPQNLFSLLNEVSCFQISLRHGCLCIIATGNYFWIGPLLNSRKGDEKLEYIPTLRSLFRRIERDFPYESKRTRYYIKDFLNQLETAYEKIRQSIHDLDHLSRDTVQFLTHQILSMIRTLDQAL